MKTTNKFKSILIGVLSIFIWGTAVAKTVTRGPASEKKIENLSGVVERVRQDDEGLNVFIKGKESIYYLRNDVIEFDKARLKLEASVKNKKPIQMTVESEELNILEVK